MKSALEQVFDVVISNLRILVLHMHTNIGCLQQLFAPFTFTCKKTLVVAESRIENERPYNEYTQI